MTDNKPRIGKQRSRRWACTHAGLVLENAMASGWPHEYLEEAGWGQSDIDSVCEKLEETIQDLFSRGLMEIDEKFFTSDNPPKEGSDN